MFTAIKKITREKVMIDEVLQEAKEKEYIYLSGKKRT